MDPDRIAALPPAPEDLPEWEDLLVRFEIMGRALRVTLEEAPAGAEAAAILRRMVADDAALAGWLHAASTGDGAVPGDVDRDGRADSGAFGAADSSPGPALDDELRALADRFASLRARNFAMLQRRGIDVWGWTAPPAGAGVVTAYQMVSARVAADAEALKGLRDGISLGAAAC